MLIVSVLSQKGGVGKTTLAVHMAVASAAEGRKTLLLDLDEQETAVAFLAHRASVVGDSDKLDYVAVGRTLQSQLEAAVEEGYELVVIDSPPHSTNLAREAVNVSDVVIMPCRPNPFDVHAITRTAWLKPDLTVIPAAVVLTQGKPNSPKAHRENGQAIGQIVQLDVLPDYIPDRTVWSQSAALGWTVIDAAQSGSALAETAKRAADEFNNIWGWVKSQLGYEVA